jgi:glyoxylase-like metal-dependent hydrolase (beta-lactamase superfamily II)
VKPIADRIYGFTGLIAGRVYAIAESDGLTLIDTGLARTAGRVLQQVRRAGYALSDVRRILITHAHIDHGGGAHRIQQETGAALMVSALEAGAMRGAEETPRPTNKRFTLMPRTTFEPSPVARELYDGDRIAGVLGDLFAVATPGHTLGHLSYWSPSRRVLFTGDVVLHTLGISFPLPFVSVDMAMNAESARKIAALEPDTILFGHGPPIVGGAAHRLNGFVRRRT